MNTPAYPPHDGNGWSSWGRHVLAELERLNDKLESVDKCLSEMKVELAMLKVRSGVWGMAGSAAVIGLAILVQFVKGG